jgi:hypothetical protein
VTGIENYSSTLDRLERSLSVEMTVITQFGSSNISTVL